MLLAAWLRLGALDRESLWLDELYSVHVATRPSWAELYASLALDVHPPLWFALLHLMPDAGEAGWRIPSALVGVAGVALTALIARRLAGGGVHGDRAMLLVAGLVATAPSLVLIDREARANAALSAATLALIALYLQPRSRLATLGLGLLAAAIVNLHPFGPFVLIGLAAFAGLDSGDGTQLSRRGALLVCAVGAVALAPWALAAGFGQIRTFSADPWYAAPPGDSLGWVLGELSDGQPGLLAVPLLGLAIGARQEGAGERRSLLCFSAFATALVLLPQAISYGFSPILRSRSALPLLPILLVAAGLGLARAGRVGVALGAVACIGQALASWHATRVETRLEQWREAAEYVAGHAAPGAVIVANHPDLWRVYLKEGVKLAPLPDPGVDASPDLWVLLGHGAELPEAYSRLPVLETAAFFGARALHLAGYSPALTVELEAPGFGLASGQTAQLWGAGTVVTAPLRLRGDCAVVVLAHEDSAGTEAAELRVRLMRGDSPILDERLRVASGPLATGRAPGLDDRTETETVRVTVGFVNDVVIDGRDRNAYIDEVRVDCR